MLFPSKNLTFWLFLYALFIYLICFPFHGVLIHKLSAFMENKKLYVDVTS